jgi:hypothetical protein
MMSACVKGGRSGASQPRRDLIPRNDSQQEPPSPNQMGTRKPYKTGKQWNRSENTAETKPKSHRAPLRRESELEKNSMVWIRRLLQPNTSSSQSFGVPDQRLSR